MLLDDFAVMIESKRVITKKAIASHVVNFASTFVVWDPKTLSVSPPPKAAPNPSLRGRCMRTTNTISKQMRTCKIIKTGKSMDIRRVRILADRPF